MRKIIFSQLASKTFLSTEKFFFSNIQKKSPTKSINKTKKSNSIFINESTKIKKYEPTKSFPTKILSKNANPSNQMDFESFTRKLSKSEIELEENKNNKGLISLLPWISNYFKEIPKEENLISPIDLYHIIKEDEAKILFNKFTQALQEFDFDCLSTIIENTFFSKLQRNLQELQKSKQKIIFESSEEDKISIDLFRVVNIFGVGILLNRKRNFKSSRYIINDSKFNNAPIQQIVLKRLTGKDRGTFIIQLHLAISSNKRLKILNGSNAILYQDNNLENNFLHYMVIESEIMDCDYKTLKHIARLDHEKNDEFTMNEKIPNFRIIDFDNFMNGNDLVKNDIFF